MVTRPYWSVSSRKAGELIRVLPLRWANVIHTWDLLKTLTTLNPQLIILTPKEELIWGASKLTRAPVGERLRWRMLLLFANVGELLGAIVVFPCTALDSWPVTTPPSVSLGAFLHEVEPVNKCEFAGFFFFLLTWLPNSTYNFTHQGTSFLLCSVSVQGRSIKKNFFLIFRPF